MIKVFEEKKGFRGKFIIKSQEQLLNYCTNWNGVVFWLQAHHWEKWHIEWVHPTFQDKVEKLKKSGHKAHFTAPQRTLDIYKQLLQGEKLKVEHLAFNYGKHVESIKEDIRNIRKVIDLYDEALIFNRREKVYELIGDSKELDAGDVVLFLILLYQSKSLMNKERKALESKLICKLPLEEQQTIRAFFTSYDFHYQTFQQKEQLVWLKLAIKSIVEKRLLSFDYYKKDEIKHHIVKPLSLSFHDGVFYLMGEIVHHEKKYQPVHFRLDRLKQMKLLVQRFRKDEPHSFFSVGEFSKMAVQMFTGQEITVKVKAVAWLEEYIYRQFPHATKMEERGDGVIMEIRVLSTEGILFWLLSQQNHVEVLAPLTFRNKIKDIIHKMSQVYNSEENTNESP